MTYLVDATKGTGSQMFINQITSYRFRWFSILIGILEILFDFIPFLFLQKTLYCTNHLIYWPTLTRASNRSWGNLAPCNTCWLLAGPFCYSNMLFIGYSSVDTDKITLFTNFQFLLRLLLSRTLNKDLQLWHSSCPPVAYRQIYPWHSDRRQWKLQTDQEGRVAWRVADYAPYWRGTSVFGKHFSVECTNVTLSQTALAQKRLSTK